MARSLTRAILPGPLLLTAATVASAQPVAVPDTWGGDFWSRPRLTGNWGGFRDELYYNFAITGWLNATLDLQVIEPALQKTVGSSGRLDNVDTTVVAGLRLRARF